MMDTPSIIREFLDENRIGATRSVEIAYRYHAELEPGCRLNGCEMIMRSVGEEVLVRAELPVNVMTKESRGVVKYLADLNKKRVGEGKQGYFDLDYVAGKIVFAIRVRQPVTTDLLKEVACYCIDQIEYESDDLLKVVCEECESVLQEEEELRQQREKNMHGSGIFGSLVWRLRNWISEIIRPGSSKRRGPGGVFDDDAYEDFGYDYGYAGDGKPGASHRTRPPYRPYRPKAPIFDTNDEDEGYGADDKEEKEPVRTAGTGYGYGEPEPDAEEDSDEAPIDPMTNEEFAEFVNRHFYDGEAPDDEQSAEKDDEDVIGAGPAEDEEAEEPQPEKKPDEEKTDE